MDQHNLALLIPIISVIGAFTMIVALRYLQNKERMAMIERGMDLKDLYKKPNLSRAPTSTAMMFIGAGLGLLAAILLTRAVQNLSDDESTGIYFALIAIGAGGGMLLAARSQKRGDDGGEA